MSSIVQKYNVLKAELIRIKAACDNALGALAEGFEEPKAVPRKRRNLKQDRVNQFDKRYSSGKFKS